MAVVSLRPNTSELPNALMFIGGYTFLSGVVMGAFILFIGVILVPLGILAFAIGGVTKLIRHR